MSFPFKNLCFISLLLANLYADESPALPSDAAESSVFSSESDPSAFPKEEISYGEIKGDKVIVETIRAIVLIKEDCDILYRGLKEYQGIEFIRVDVPGKKRHLAELLTKKYLGKPLTQNRILEIEDAVTEYYKENYHPFVIVTAPRQRISSGVLQLMVTESTIDQISFIENAWFSTGTLRKYVRLKEGGTVNSNILAQDLMWMNRNPFRDTVAIFSPGMRPATTNVEFLTKDRMPYRLTLGGDNTGIVSTGRGRLFAGVDLGNLFGVDQILSYQYITSVDFGKFYAHTAQWQVPLPWRHWLNMYGGYSGIQADIDLQGTSSRGHSWQASMRYQIPIPPDHSYTQEVIWGLDYKATNVNLFSGDLLVLGQQTVITQAMLGYQSSLQNSVVNSTFDLQAYLSPGDIFGYQSNQDYQSLRPDAKSHYIYFRAKATPIFHLPAGCQIVTKFEGQWANENLLSSEQFGLGGYATVRGYDERILNTDNGFLASAEFRTPTLRVFTQPTSKNNEEFQYLAFMDYGFGINHQRLPVPGQQNFFYLWSTGVGFRYRLNANIVSRFDWGYAIHQDIADNIQAASNRIHFSFILSY